MPNFIESELFKPYKIMNIWNLFYICLIVFILSNVESILPIYGLDRDLHMLTSGLKIIRELLILIISIIVYQHLTISKSLWINFIFLSLLVLFSLSSGIYNIFWGLRFLVPMFFLLSPYKPLELPHKPYKLQKIIDVILYSHVLLQLIHLFFGIGYFAKFAATGLNTRNPGLMYYPGASAFLTLALFILSYSIDRKIRNLFVVSISILLCSSITGLATFLALVILIQKKLTNKQKLSFVFYFVFSFYILHLARYTGGGATYLDQTAGGRARLLNESVLDINLSFLNGEFGKATNGARIHSNGRIVESSYAAIFANLGAIWSLLLISILLYYAFLQRLIFVDLRNRLILCTFILVSFGMIITEATFPFLLLVMSKLLASNSKEA